MSGRVLQLDAGVAFFCGGPQPKCVIFLETTKTQVPPPKKHNIIEQSKKNRRHRQNPSQHDVPRGFPLKRHHQTGHVDPEPRACGCCWRPAAAPGRGSPPACAAGSWHLRTVQTQASPLRRSKMRLPKPVSLLRDPYIIHLNIAL